MFRALIMGPPGSGKGTISARIVRDFKFCYVSSGDALREEILKNTSKHNLMHHCLFCNVKCLYLITIISNDKKLVF